MRLLTATAIAALIASMPGFGQTLPTAVPATVFNQSNNVQDSAGNLVILDFGALLTSTGVGGGVTGGGGIGIGRPFLRAPKVRVTVLRPSGTDSVVFDGAFQFVGIGGKAIYGVLTTRQRPAPPQRLRF